MRKIALHIDNSKLGILYVKLWQDKTAQKSERGKDLLKVTFIRSKIHQVKEKDFITELGESQAWKLNNERLKHFNIFSSQNFIQKQKYFICFALFK